MRRQLALLALFVTHGGAHAGNFLPEMFQFKPDGQSSNANRFGAAATMQVERGEHRGNSYSIWADGVAEVAHWKIKCSQDQMTDERSCLIQADDFWVLITSAGVKSVVIGDKHHPGKPVVVRVDDQKAIESKTPGWSGKQAQSIFKAASNGKVIATRYWRWPESSWTDNKTTAAGLSQALDVAVWMCKQKP